MCICGLKRTIFRNGTLKSSINTGRYTADYLQCGNLPYLAWKKRMTAHILSYRRIRRYLALSLLAGSSAVYAEENSSAKTAETDDNEKEDPRQERMNLLHAMKVNMSL